MNIIENLYIENPENPLVDFERIANLFLNQSILRVNEKTYRICSVEFYYQNEMNNDKAAHKHKRQLTIGEWYFHGSGLDITFGKENEYGGILIQAIQQLHLPNQFIAGPLNVITHIFENFGSINLSNLYFGLEFYKHHKEEIISAPRVGLNIKTVGADFSKGYRFLILPKEAHARKIDVISHLVNSGQMSEKEAKDIIYK
ncbi:hypothetical protein [Marivirga sp.]|uniref:hypothetical protein n=1 Tax=Marivirga sp. TaxID=2018662 RepID=UPI003DA78D68